MRLPPALLASAVLLGAACLAGTSRASTDGVLLSPMETVTPGSGLLPRPGIGITADIARAATMDEVLAGEASSSTAETAAGGRPMAIEYSESYNVRRKIHFIASFATLPLFATEYVLGAKLYDGNASGSVRNAHGVVAGSLGVLFGINTLTGVWNMYDTRAEPAGRTRRLLHGALMLVADAGFVASGATAPESEEGSRPVDSSGKNKHRAIAVGSMGVATLSYLIMLIGR
jgi:hypothetical protein